MSAEPRDLDDDLDGLDRIDTADPTPTPAPATQAPEWASIRPRDQDGEAAGERPGRRREWSWRHGPVVGPLNAGLGLSGAAMVADLAAVSPWWGTAAGLAAAAGVTVRAASRQISPLGLTYRAACWAGAGGWMTWALATSAWSPDVLAAVAAGTLAAGLAAPELSEHEDRVRGRRHRAEAAAVQAQTVAAAAASRVAIAMKWEARLERVCRVRTTIEKVQMWPEDAGYTLQAKLPRGGTTWQQIASHIDGLAADANLPLGCGVEVSHGKTRGIAILRVATVDTTQIPRPYPDTSPLTFTQPLPVGMEHNAKVADVPLLEDPALVIGRQGSGKTGLLQNINAGVVRSVDALNWHIDLNGAGMSRPWLAPWLAGETDRPVVDWVAATVEEAIFMVQTAIAMAEGRKGLYQGLMASVDDDKIPISAAVPAVEITLDEGAEAMAMNRGSKDLVALLDKLVSIARAARFRLVASGLRATADILPPNIKAQAGPKIWMRPDDQHEVAQLLGWNSGASVEDAPHPGTGLLRRPSSPAITAFRAYRLTPSRIREIAIACTDRRPVLDAPTARIGGAIYAQRWDRYRAWQATQAGGTVPMPQPRIPGPDDEPGHEPGDEKNTGGQDQPRNTSSATGGGIAGLAAAKDEMDASLERLREVRRAAEARQNGGQPSDIGQDVEAAFAAIVGAEDWTGDNGGSGQDGPADESSSVTPAGPAQMLLILAGAGENGLHWEALQARLKATGHDISKATLYRWLNAAGDQVTQPREGRWARRRP